MEPLSHLLPAVTGSSAQANQELTQLKTGEESLFIDALRYAPIKKAHEDLIKEALRYAMVKIGLRSQNWPQDEEKSLLINHIRREYGNHTVAEIRLAFDMAISGKLDFLSGESVNCYENFSCLYFSSIMNAYRKWAAQVHCQLQPEHTKIDSVTEDTSDESMEKWLIETKKSIYSVDLLPVMLYDWLEQNGRIKKTVAEKHEYLQEAVMYRQSKLIKALEEQISQDNRDALQKFNRMKESGEFTGPEVSILKALAKKIILFEYLNELK